jgi:hypothetical protein
MMSKERELLEQCRMYLSSLGMFVEHSTLINEIDELLSQPEQEPVAWMYEWEEIGGKEWTSVKNGKYPPIVEEEYCMRNLRPLYTAPPTRNPLTPQQISVGNQSMLNVTREAFVKGVKWAEQQHGIGGE